MERNTNRYQGLDLIRAVASVLILLMHVYANGEFMFKTGITENARHFCADLVFLFMMLSAISICCGYYEKIKTSKISLNEFYIRRFKRIWPFFFVLIILEIIVSHSARSLVEGYYNSTLLFGFLPNPKMDVVGVGWFIGVVFAFYLLFPFFVFSIWNKKRAIIVFILSFTATILFEYYSSKDGSIPIGFDPRTNILYCLVYFYCGGLIYLYREKMEMKSWKMKIISSILILLLLFAYIMRPEWIFGSGILVEILRICLFGLIVVLCMNGRSRVFNNRTVKYLSGISLYIYLSHMVVFRVLEKCGCLYTLGRGVVSFCVDAIVILFGTIIFQLVINRLIGFCENTISKIVVKEK